MISSYSTLAVLVELGKTHLIKALMFGLSIIQKHDDVLLTASTGAAAANIGGATYHSALGYGKNASQPVRQATRSRLSHKKIFNFYFLEI